MKPLFEAQRDSSLFGVYFVNDGEGGSLVFPAQGGTRDNAVQYISYGCEWMREINPHTGRPYGTGKQISRCNPANEMVPLHRFNPIERAWFWDCVSRGSKRSGFHWFGPVRSLSSGEKHVGVCKPVFDRMYVSLKV